MPHIENIWQESSANLRQFILKRIPDQSIAEDVLQEVFVKIHSRIDTLKDVRRLQGWIYQITRNAIIDYYRSKNAVPELPESLKNSEDSNDNPVIYELAPCVEAMVNRLPERYRQAVILTAYQGLTQKEMGEKLGLSHSGAKSRVKRAREKLKNMLIECCHFEFDRLGKLISYEPKNHSAGKC